MPCETDAQAAIAQEKKGKPLWLDLSHELVAHARHASRGRPRKEEIPREVEWQIVTTVTLNQERVEQEAFRKACWIVGTNILDTVELSDEMVAATYKDQGGVERGCAFSQRPLVPGFLRLCQKARTDYGTEPDHGLVLVGLSPGRISAAGAFSADGANHP